MDERPAPPTTTERKRQKKPVSLPAALELKRRVRDPVAAELMGCSVCTLNRNAKAIPGFPQPRRVSRRLKLWVVEELLEWKEGGADE